MLFRSKFRRMPRLHTLLDLRQFWQWGRASSHLRWRSLQVKQPVRTRLGLLACGGSTGGAAWAESASLMVRLLWWLLLRALEEAGWRPLFCFFNGGWLAAELEVRLRAGVAKGSGRLSGPERRVDEGETGWVLA